MAPHSIPAGPGRIKRAKYVSFVANPERDIKGVINNSYLFDHQLTYSNFSSKPLARSLHENGIGFDGNNGVSLGQVVRTIVAIIHSHVIDEFRLAQRYFSLQSTLG